MEDMERGLEEMAQSVEHMQGMLKRSPMVQALAQHKPEVRALSALRRHQGNVILRARETSLLAQVSSSVCAGEADLERPEEAAGGDGVGSAQPGGPAECGAGHAEPAQAPAGTWAL